MASLGLNLSSVGQTMQTAFNGNTDGKFKAGEYEYCPFVREVLGIGLHPNVLTRYRAYFYFFSTAKGSV